jgi:hypothetical protein
MPNKSTKPAKVIELKNSEEEKTEESVNTEIAQTGGSITPQTEKGGTNH